MSTTEQRLWPDEAEQYPSFDLEPKGIVRRIYSLYIWNIAAKVKKTRDFDTELKLDHGSILVTTSSLLDDDLSYKATRTSLIWINNSTHDRLPRTVQIDVDYASPDRDDKYPHIVAKETKVASDGSTTLLSSFDSLDSGNNSLGLSLVQAHVDHIISSRPKD